MQLKWGHLCVDARFDSFGADIANLLTGYGADPGQPLRLDVRSHFAFRIFASTEAEVEGQALDIIVTDTNNKQVAGPFPGEVSFIPVGSDRAKYPLIGGGKVRLDNQALPPAGAYSIDLHLSDGTLLGRFPFTISLRQGKDPNPKLKNPSPVRLAWAHVLIDVKQDETGLYNLIGIFEFIPPTGKKGVNLKDWIVLVQIEADPTINVNRQLRAELLDEKNGPARDATGRAVSTFQRPITLRRGSRSSDLLSSMAPIRFKDDIWLTPGIYRLRFHLDDEELGNPLELIALPSFPPP